MRPGSQTGGERGKTVLGLPEQNFDNWQTGVTGLLVDEPGDVLRRRVRLHHEDSLPALTEQRQQGIVAAEQHVVVQVLIDPALNLLLDLAEIDQYSPLIQLGALQGNQGPAVMTVEMAALALVVHQTVPVTEMDLAGDSKHRGAVPGLVSGDWRSAHHPRGSRAHSRQGSGSGPEHPRPGIPSAAPHICYTTHSAFRTPDRCTRKSGGEEAPFPAARRRASGTDRRDESDGAYPPARGSGPTPDHGRNRGCCRERGWSPETPGRGHQPGEAGTRLTP